MDLRAPGVWRPRHAALFDFLKRYSATATQLAEGFFTGRTMETQKRKARRWLTKQRRRKRIFVVGIVQRRDTGRPELVYGRRCKQDQIEHELRVTDFALVFKDSRLTRDAKVGRTEADALMIRDGHRCYVEIDNSGKMTAKQMEAKWKRYDGVDGFILVVAVTEGRMQRLRRGAELVKDAALFTTFDRLRAGGSEPWVDWYGNTVGI
jgi:hypothetical protein